jgi:chromosome segregation protein
VRLNSIKLSGFKSFSEPTNFQLPGQLVGVVGPNGCGKSNIMDAVRWVLGESKASELRGESMQDVIFNGTTTRKPASRASVELVFENADHRAGGQWGQFVEIAVKRVLTRDGTSSYYINNQPVRRRDVQDVFLGTGLGPRAYAIIGQGTISRIIESKPEELRLFLEEAAGVSKYKERRRETENRLSDTRENLTRVEDILRELGANLDKLEKQAEVAQRYKGLQADVTLKQQQLWTLKLGEARNEQVRLKADTDAAINAMEGRTADLRRIEADLEAVRQAHYAAGDQVNQAQGLLYEASTEVGRLEAEIRFVVEGRQRVEQRLQQLKEQAVQWADRSAQAEEEMATLGERDAQAQEDNAVLAAQVEEHAQALPDLEDALRRAQAESTAQRGSVAQVQQQIQVLAAEQRSVEEQSRQVQSREERLRADQRALAAPGRWAARHACSSSSTRRRRQPPWLEARLHELQEASPSWTSTRRSQQQAVNQTPRCQASLSARLDALKALQEKVKTDGKLQALARAPWSGHWQACGRIHVEAGWETALEAALRERLNALAVGRLDTVRAFATDAPPAKLAFYATPAGAAPHTHQTLPQLAQRLQLGDAGLKALLSDWLEGVYTATSIDEALAQRSQLTPGEVIMTREGHAVSAHAVAFYAPDSEQAGMLARAQEIENLGRQQKAQALIADDAKSASVRLEAAYTEASQHLQTARREAAEAQNRAHGLHVELLRLTQQAEAATSRREQLSEELAEIDAQMEALEERKATGEARFEELDIGLGDAQQKHAELEDAVIAAERKLADAREQQRALERQAQEARFQARALAARRDELQRSIETAAAQVAANLQAGEQLQLELGSFDDAAAQSGLQAALELKSEREKALGLARSEYDDLSAQLRRADEQKLGFERSLEPLREQITKLQLELQAAQLGGAQFLEQLTAAEVDLEALAQGIERDGIKLWGLQTEIDRIQKEINALGAVNLAALDELTASRERKTFLDAQNADLLDAIGTLEDAITKIDLETRDLLASTFNQVNEHFGRMFPTLFGGGNAKLVMTGTEILDAGVQVMAQPPGKKNSTIHLLSGGEKALTAIALVFAIFMLNPAPFCLLDEVDAPLDDANTERYRNLVHEMSLKGTQFLFISHNKIAMEMAEQLIGVTMQEQGVSRIVAVDMESAVNLAEI